MLNLLDIPQYELSGLFLPRKKQDILGYKGKSFLPTKEQKIILPSNDKNKILRGKKRKGPKILEFLETTKKQQYEDIGIERPQELMKSKVSLEEEKKEPPSSGEPISSTEPSSLPEPPSQPISSQEEQKVKEEEKEVKIGKEVNDVLSSIGKDERKALTDKLKISENSEVLKNYVDNLKNEEEKYGEEYKQLDKLTKNFGDKSSFQEKLENIHKVQSILEKVRNYSEEVGITLNLFDEVAKDKAINTNPLYNSSSLNSMIGSYVQEFDANMGKEFHVYAESKSNGLVNIDSFINKDLPLFVNIIKNTDKFNFRALHNIYRLVRVFKGIDENKNIYEEIEKEISKKLTNNQLMYSAIPDISGISELIVNIIDGNSKNINIYVNKLIEPPTSKTIFEQVINNVSGIQHETKEIKELKVTSEKTSKVFNKMLDEIKIDTTLSLRGGPRAKHALNQQRQTFIVVKGKDTILTNPVKLTNTQMTKTILKNITDNFGKKSITIGNEEKSLLNPETWALMTENALNNQASFSFSSGNSGGELKSEQFKNEDKELMIIIGHTRVMDKFTNEIKQIQSTTKKFISPKKPQK